MPTQPTPHASGPANCWEGQLCLRFQHSQGQTLPAEVQVKAPLKFQRPFYPEGPQCCHGILLHTAGGLVGGDRLLFEVELGPSAQVLLTTAAAAKIYGSRGQSALHPEGQVAEQQIRLVLAPESHLEWLPQETILFEGALFHQTLRVELGSGATFLAWEITRLGRTARGEQFLRGDWKALTEVWQGDDPSDPGKAHRPLWIDPQWLPGDPQVWSSPHGLNQQPLVASLLWMGREVSPALVACLRGYWSGEGEAGVSRLQEGVICRWRGRSTAEVQRWFRAVWDLLRREFRGRPACPPRAWMIY